MKKSSIILSLFVSFMIPTLLMASPFSLITSWKSQGNLAGGLRYALTDQWVFDGWATQYENNNQIETSYWAAIYYKNWGVIVSGSNAKNSTLNTAFAYAVEHPLMKNITLGSSVKLFELSNQPAMIMGGWDLYLVLAIN